MNSYKKNKADAENEKTIWIDEAADVINGNILTLKFQVLDNAPDGLAEVTVAGSRQRLWMRAR